MAETLTAAWERLAAAGVASPRLDARLILAHVLGVPPAAVALDRGRFLTDAERADVERLTRRRAAREPVSHLFGQREFWSLPFVVTADVLDPRPDSETIIDAVLATIPDRHAPLRLLDLGTGSGCLLLSLLTELPRAHGVGIDCSVAACRIAVANAASLGLMHRAMFLAGDWGAALSGYFDVVVANPPYIADDVIDSLAPEVSRYEPRLALSGGLDGLDAYRRLGPDMERLLAERGLAVLEIGAGMAEAVTAILGEYGLVFHSMHRDLAGHPRGLVMMHRTGKR